MTGRAGVDAAVIAALLHRSPSYVRRQVQAHVLTPLPVRRSLPRGRPKMVFDLVAVTRVVDTMPWLVGPVLDKR